MLVVGVGGLWGRMGGRLRVGWEVGLVLAYEDGQQKGKKKRLTLVQHDTPPIVPIPFFLPLFVRHPRHEHKVSQK